MRRWVYTGVCAAAMSMAHGSAAAQDVSATHYSQGFTTYYSQALAPSALQGFSIVLVLGDTQAGATAGDMPAAASRALADMKDFLPYKSYRLLDTAWILGSKPTVVGRLRGPDNRDYEVGIDTTASGHHQWSSYMDTLKGQAAAGKASGEKPVAAAIAIRFRLHEARTGSEPGGSANTTERRYQELATQKAGLERQIQTAENLAGRRLVADGVLQDLRNDLTAVDAQMKTLSGARIIDTTFDMQIGETVVVGTSRMQGNTALIVLLTAVPRSSK